MSSSCPVRVALFSPRGAFRSSSLPRFSCSPAASFFVLTPSVYLITAALFTDVRGFFCCLFYSVLRMVTSALVCSFFLSPSVFFDFAISDSFESGADGASLAF